MMALQWGIDFPEKARSVIAMATTARQSAQAIAFNAVGRSAIMQDPAWNRGDYEPDKGPNVGLAVARMMAHITYLSNKSLDSKFGRARRGHTSPPLPANGNGGDTLGHISTSNSRSRATSSTRGRASSTASTRTHICISRKRSTALTCTGRTANWRTPSSP